MYRIPIITGIISVVATGIGLVALHKVNKDHPGYIRAFAVILAFIGIISLWSVAASTTPPLINKESEVSAIGPGFMIIKLTYTPVRNCEIGTFTAVLITGNNRLEVPATFVTEGTIGEENTREHEHFLYVGVTNSYNLAPDTFYLTVSHSCPFGFSFVTDFPITRIPPGFNENLPGFPRSEFLPNSTVISPR